MNNSLKLVAALASGVFFGIGMALSGMTDPAKVIGFLDVAGNWDPSLAYVMGGALAVFLPCYQRFIKPRKHTLSGEPLCLPSNTTIDKRLVSGAAVFGVGWGLVGVCPGPAVASISYGNIGIFAFIGAMLVGSLVAKSIISK
ncbi:YeeE/YedE family protein [Vibrio taketomensis]|uniref:YeeE/YedE family protein n=1 Tax=Vibrio taketomensis TaxID=2572923 RepID=UPI00138A2DA2|nr:YeeE/YedE family protein [Vibrio taketomensis]